MKGVLIVILLVLAVVNAQRLVGYYTNWAQYRQGIGKFVPENITAIVNKITAIHYAFAKFDTSGNVIPIEWNDCPQGMWPGCQGYSDTMYERIIALKKLNPNLKAIISIGGWSWGGVIACPTFSQMAANPSARQNFVTQAVNYTKVFGWDGVDIDWEYPGYIANGCSASDPKNFVALMTELRAQMNSVNPSLLLTCATPANITTMDVMLLNQTVSSVDYFSIMTYDYYGSWDTISGENAPLLGLTTPHDHWNVEDTVTSYLNTGIPASKIVLGCGMYGHTFLSSTLGGPSTGAGPAGPYTGQAGILAYYEILALSNPTTTFNTAVQCPVTTYSQNGQTVLAGYDNPQSLSAKVAFLKSKNLSGAMVWAFDEDQFQNGAYPLINQIANGLGL